MRILVLSDLHIEFGTFVVPEDVDYDVVILAGDIAVPGVKAVHWASRQSTFGRVRHVLLSPGNHEFYGQCIQRELIEMLQASNTRLDLRPLLKPEHTLEFHRQERAWLENKLAKPFDGPTVVITHQAPHRNSMAEEYQSDWVSAAFASEFPDHFFDVPVLWVRGHTHTSFDYRVGNCREVCNPRGYMEGHPKPKPENAAFNPGFVIDIEETP
jgi:predicted phosphodiesterase